MKKFFNILIFLIVAFSLFIVAGAKIKSFGRKYIATNEKGFIIGDMYKYCPIDKFKTRIEIKENKEMDTIQAADIVFLEILLQIHHMIQIAWRMKWRKILALKLIINQDTTLTHYYFCLIMGTAIRG